MVWSAAKWIYQFWKDILALSFANSNSVSFSTKMKFGLNVKSKKPRGVFTPRNAFQQEDDSSDNEDSNDQKSHRSTVNQQLSKSGTITKKIAEQHAKALEEDANIFDYDAVYDDLKQAERLKKEATKGPETKKVMPQISS